LICRGCGNELSLTFLDLGISPIANNLVSHENLEYPDKSFPLKTLTCTKCSLVQLSEIVPRDMLFTAEYVYYSSYSKKMLAHSKKFASKMLNLLNLGSEDLVIEVASNDGYLLQYFLENKIRVLGIEPAKDVAQSSIQKGIPTLVEFFGEELAKRLATAEKPRLIIANNVIAHVPDIHDFIKGLSTLISDKGLITLEFPHLLNLIRNCQFDTIYHEHYSYINVTALLPIFQVYGLKIVKIEKISTHGGSLRIYVVKDQFNWKIENSLMSVLEEEMLNDPRTPGVYKSIQRKVQKIREELLGELIARKSTGSRISAYGAAAKGITLLNYCEIGPDLIEFVIDLNPHKIGKFLPGARIPVLAIEALKANPPDVLLILPWNLADEIKVQLNSYLAYQLKTLRAIPKVEYF
jgi:hypothetical protein